MLDSNYDLSNAAFETDNSTVWGGLQVALSASLPPNIVYNLTIYDVNDEAGQIYTYVTSISNAESLGATTDVSTYTVASSNVTFNVTPEKIGEQTNGGTLYILNCSDANGWWITGYTAQSLAQDLYNLLSPYFVNTIMVQNTSPACTNIKRNTDSRRNPSKRRRHQYFWRSSSHTNNLLQAQYSSDSTLSITYLFGAESSHSTIGHGLAL